jgi:hypothetical protein
MDRLEIERKTVKAMILLYCGAHHQHKGLCKECQALCSFAEQRLNGCVYQNSKPTCGRCPIHCYKPDMRKKIQEVMRYAGPRMLWRHPLLAVIHMMDRFRRTPPRPRKSSR